MAKSFFYHNVLNSNKILLYFHSINNHLITKTTNQFFVRKRWSLFKQRFYLYRFQYSIPIHKDHSLELTCPCSLNLQVQILKITCPVSWNYISSSLKLCVQFLEITNTLSSSLKLHFRFLEITLPVRWNYMSSSLEIHVLFIAIKYPVPWNYMSSSLKSFVV